MALWGKNGSSEKGPTDHSLSIIGEGAQVEGTLQIPGNLRIEGIFSGQATVGNRLVIAESGQVLGTLRARELLIAGAFEGEIRDAQHVEITGSARIKGSIHSQKLEVHSGALLHITCQIGDIGQIPSTTGANGLTPKSESSSRSPETAPSPAKAKSK